MEDNFNNHPKKLGHKLCDKPQLSSISFSLTLWEKKFWNYSFVSNDEIKG